MKGQTDILAALVSAPEEAEHSTRAGRGAVESGATGLGGVGLAASTLGFGPSCACVNQPCASGFGPVSQQLGMSPMVGQVPSFLWNSPQHQGPSLTAVLSRLELRKAWLHAPIQGGRECFPERGGRAEDLVGGSRLWGESSARSSPSSRSSMGLWCSCLDLGRWRRERTCPCAHMFQVQEEDRLQS